MTAAERLTREAAEKARSETLARIVLKQLELKFGPLGPEMLEQVRHSTIEQMDAMVERILTANSIDDVLG